jgi:hypothetical protein
VLPDASTIDSLDDCLQEFQRLANGHERVRRILSTWDRVVLLEVLDDGRRYCMKTTDGAVTFVPPVAPEGAAGVVHVRAKEKILREVFTGRRNAARAFFDAEMEVFADEKDQVKLETITMILWNR